MKFFLADSQDHVDPSFDFLSERRARHRLRQRDDLYVHEVFSEPPIDGILISKAIVDGCNNKPGKYSLGQRNRLRRAGIRAFFRLDRKDRRRIATMGDCGAFSYVSDRKPPYTVPEVLDFYSDCGVDFGISVDHVILGYQPAAELPGKRRLIPPEYRERQGLTLELARQFRLGAKGAPFVPLGVAQGWSPQSYATAVSRLQQMGYAYIALGGMVPLKTKEVLACLEAVNAVRRRSTKLHLLGITRCEHAPMFGSYGVRSFDSTSPLLQAFKDGEANYHTNSGSYVALRVPQADGNTKLKRSILAGVVDQRAARTLEKHCLELLRAYDRDSASMSECLEALDAYEAIHEARSQRREDYRRTLEDRPWKLCSCDICRALGIEVIIFRGSERNKRRGFHNLYVLFQRLQALKTTTDDSSSRLRGARAPA